MDYCNKVYEKNNQKKGRRKQRRPYYKYISITTH